MIFGHLKFLTNKCLEWNGISLKVTGSMKVRFRKSLYYIQAMSFFYIET